KKPAPPNVIKDLRQSLPPNWARTRPQLRLPLGIALWNLVPAREGPKNEELVDLLSEVLDMDLETARQLRRDQTSILPPYPGIAILGASRNPNLGFPRHYSTDAKDTMQIVVQTRFEDLQGIVNPETWSACDWFWSNIRPSQAPIRYKSGNWSGMI